MIFDIQRFSTHDGPGIRTVVFFKGCPLACEWCENPESQSFKPELLYKRSDCVGCGSCLRLEGSAVKSDGSGGILVAREVEPPASIASACPAKALRLAGREASIPLIMGELLKDMSFFAKSGGGLTLSGGEPLAQIDLAEGLIRAAQAAGVDVAIETCLAVSRINVERVVDLPLHWLADLKHVDPAAFRAATCGDARLVLGNLRFLAERGADLNFRVPVIPGFNDDEASMRGILEFAAALPPLAGGAASGGSAFGGSVRGRRVDLLPYHDLAAGKYAALGRKYNFSSGARVEGDRMESYAELGLSLGLDISLGG